jgi:hypothetical protein
VKVRSESGRGTGPDAEVMVFEKSKIWISNLVNFGDRFNMIDGACNMTLAA